MKYKNCLKKIIKTIVNYININYHNRNIKLYVFRIKSNVFGNYNDYFIPEKCDVFSLGITFLRL